MKRSSNNSNAFVKNPISIRLKAAREYREMKQSYLAQLMGQTQQAYSYLENCTANRTLELSTLQRFCDVTGISIHLLLSENVPINEATIKLFEKKGLSGLIEEHIKLQHNISFYEAMFPVRKTA
jgi:transcriptional regulator with XRE-family HTH domain